MFVPSRRHPFWYCKCSDHPSLQRFSSMSHDDGTKTLKVVIVREVFFWFSSDDDEHQANELCDEN